MNILGLSTFCDSSAAIIRDGEIVCAVEEERLNRIKHYEGMPWLAIPECLSIAGMSLSDIDLIAIGWNPLLGWGARIYETIRPFIRSHHALAGKLSRGPGYINTCYEIFRLRRSLGKRFDEQNVNQKIVYVDHHLAHAASAFFASPFETADIVVADGVGEKSAISFFSGEGNRIKRIAEIRLPHSLGHIYASVTGFLGFRMTFDEGKVMALASYGEDEYADLFNRLVRINIKEKKLTIDTSLLDYHAARNGFFSREWLKLTGMVPRKNGEALTQRHKNLAHSLQSCLEKSIIELLTIHFSENQIKPLCAAGGVFLNSVLNGKIASDYSKEFFIQPAAGDDGVSIGAALFTHAKLDKNFKRSALRNAFLGREYGKKDIAAVLDQRCINYRRSNHICAEAAQLIAQENIVGWFQGRMEFGPRALGNRSILAFPQNQAIKPILNSRVKHREEFRPFACSVLSKEKSIYFEGAQESPFMLKVFKFKSGFCAKFPAICHVDLTCRIHTVTPQQNPEFYRLLQELKKLTGFGLVLNTSMNIAGEPIVNTPAQAIELIERSELDFLIMGDFIIKKSKLYHKPRA